MRALPIVAFLLLAVAANVLTNEIGMIPVGFGLIATAGTWAAGLVLLARDWVHDIAGKWAVLGCIAAGAVLSAVLTNPMLAVASTAAFAVSELADLTVYTPLRRKGWGRAAFISGVVGSVVDTFLFLHLAGFFTWPGTFGQLLAKIGITAVFVLLAKAVARALLRHRIGTQGV